MNKELLLIEGLLLLLKRDDDPTKWASLIRRLEEQRTGPEVVERPALDLAQQMLDSANAPSGEFERRMEEGPEIVEIPRGGMSDEQLRDLGFEVPEEK